MTGVGPALWSMHPLFHDRPLRHTEAQPTNLQSTAIQLYNSPRLTVHLRLLNLKRKIQIKPKNPPTPDPRPR